MDDGLSLKQIQKKWHGTYFSYAVGFISSLLFTVCSFFLVFTRLFSKEILIFAIVGLALIQAVFQLLFFLHIGQEDKPRWETRLFYFMLLVLFIVVAGSLWIMFDLNERVMSHMM